MPGERSVFVGFRNPVPQGRALLVPLLNPREMMTGARAQLGPAGVAGPGRAGDPRALLVARPLPGGRR